MWLCSCGKRAALLGEKPRHGLSHNDLNQPFTLYFRLTQCYVSAEIQNQRGLWELSVSFVYPAISRTWELCFRNKLTTWHTQFMFENWMPFGTVQLKATGRLPDFKMNALWQIFPPPFLVCATLITFRAWSCSAVGKAVVACRGYGSAGALAEWGVWACNSCCSLMHVVFAQCKSLVLGFPIGGGKSTQKYRFFFFFFTLITFYRTASPHYIGKDLNHIFINHGFYKERHKKTKGTRLTMASE